MSDEHCRIRLGKSSANDFPLRQGQG